MARGQGVHRVFGYCICRCRREGDRDQEINRGFMKAVDFTSLFFAAILLLGGIAGCWAIAASILNAMKIAGGT